ncbi:mCG133599, isoform CRA_b, partial [Mus musculus]
IWTRVGLASRSKPIRSLQGRSFLLPALGKVRKVARSCGKRRWLGRGLGCGVPGRLPRLLWNASELQALDAGVQGVERQTRMDRLVRCSGPSGVGGRSRFAACNRPHSSGFSGRNNGTDGKKVSQRFPALLELPPPHPHRRILLFE